VAATEVTVPPRILVSAYEEPASWSYWRDVPAVLVPTSYMHAVRVAGGLPFLAPPLDGLAPHAAAMLEPFDGLVLTGGCDVAAARYGQTPHHECSAVQEHRDGLEIGLIEAALERDLPLLAICRGMQLLNVVLGGSLHQHIPELGPDPLRHKQGPGLYARHEVAIEPGTLLHELLGPRIGVVSSHHQATDGLGTGLHVAARDEDDGVVEALEAPAAAFCMGVQWHPEEDIAGGLPLFAALVDHAARAQTEERKGRTWR
jgi:gamma-glutamyl-gamma-aminobutyrate hydrolase PuuD